jgi:hypothetical protein
MTTRATLDLRIQQLRADRADLLMQYDHQVNQQDATPASQLPHDWGIVGDLQRDIELLQQLLRRES